MSPRSMRRWSIRMFQNFWPMFVGAVSAAICRSHDRAEDREHLFGLALLLIVGVGTFRAFQMRKYERRNSGLDV